MSELMKGKYEAEITLKEQNPFTILNEFISIVNQTGATVINSSYHIFPNQAISVIILIMESHAAIHTWPEKEKAWVGFYTCSEDYQWQIDKFKVLLKSLG